MKVDTRQAVVDPGMIMEMSHGYWVSQVLYVATKLKIFNELSGKDLTAEKIAGSLKIPTGPLTRILNASCALSLLEKKGDKYTNSASSEQFLVEGKPGYLGYGILLSEQLYASWGKLLESVKKDKPISDRFAEGSAIPEESTRLFTKAMHSYSSQVAPFLANFADLSGNKRLLDIGGGSGANAMALAEKNPNLEAVVYDLPDVVKVAAEFIAESKVAARVKTQAGDFEKDDLPKGFDAILLAQILHGEGEKASIELLKKCYDVLEPSGKIIIVDFMLNEKKDGPVMPALFALNMLVETSDGNAFSAGEISEFLTKAGFKVEAVKPLGPTPASVILASKK